MKKQVNQVEFEKRVEIAAAHMVYMDRMKPAEAQEKARAEVQSEYEVVPSK